MGGDSLRSAEAKRESKKKGGDVSIKREDPVEGTLTGRLGVLGRDRCDKRPPSASDSMWERRGREEERRRGHSILKVFYHSSPKMEGTDE